MTETWNYLDPMDEIYAIRRQISEYYHHDVRLMAAAAKKQIEILKQRGHRIISSPEELLNGSAVKM